MARRIHKLELEVAGLNNAVTELVQVVADLKQPENNKPPKNQIGVGAEDPESRGQNVEKTIRKVNKLTKNMTFEFKKQTFGKKVKSVGKSFLLNTTIHGVGRAATTQRYVVRLLWILMIGLSAYFCVYTLYRNLHDYMDYDVITVTKQVEEEQVVFPAVTVCAKWTLKKPIKLNFQHIDSCKFESQKCNLTADIQSFTRDKSTFWCLRFNGYSGIPVTKQANPFKTIPDLDSTGFQLKLDLDIEEFRFYVQDNYLNTYKNSLEYRIEKNENFRVYVTKSVDKKLGEPHNRCEISSDVAYRQSNCIEQCAHRAIANAYNCSLVYGYYAVIGLPECALNITRLKDNNMMKCEKTCPKECELTTWNAAIQPAGYSSKTVIKVFLETMNHIEISQKPKTTFWDLLSSLGGTLGFLGMSFLTFVEIFEFVFELIRNIFS